MGLNLAIFYKRRSYDNQESRNQDIRSSNPQPDWWTQVYHDFDDAFVSIIFLACSYNDLNIFQMQGIREYLASISGELHVIFHVFNRAEIPLLEVPTSALNVLPRP